jgi:ferritin-like metal-binding protein YciE
MLDSLSALFEEQLKDMYSAENQLLRALPKMAKTATHPALKKAFEKHTRETEVHVERLVKIAQQMGFKPGGKKCAAMAGLVEEGKEVLQEDGEDAVIDAALIAAAQRVEHYEISAYGTARTMAERLGESQVARLLQQTLDEESATDEKLTQISEGEVLEHALAAGGGEDEEESEG